MRNKKAGFIIGFLSLAVLGAMLSCATDKAPLQAENSLPQSELEYYNDSFDKMREDLWDRAGYLYREEQVKNFKQADLLFENGKLIIRTQTGSFSKAGLSSKYALRGDFDIQLNCRMDFIKGISSMDMDQVVNLGVFDKSLTMGKMSTAIIGLSMKGGSDQLYLFSNYIVTGKRRGGGSQKIENFNGTFRILRNGKTISTLYKINGAAEWKRLNRFRVTDNDMLIGFQVRNFFGNRTTIQANHSISAEFDSLRINAARAIIEAEI
jgi:hypothetical protein